MPTGGGAAEKHRFSLWPVMLHRGSGLAAPSILNNTCAGTLAHNANAHRHTPVLNQHFKSSTPATFFTVLLGVKDNILFPVEDLLSRSSKHRDKRYI